MFQVICPQLPWDLLKITLYWNAHNTMTWNNDKFDRSSTFCELKSYWNLIWPWVMMSLNHDDSKLTAWWPWWRHWNDKIAKWQKWQRDMLIYIYNIYIIYTLILIYICNGGTMHCTFVRVLQKDDIQRPWELWSVGLRLWRWRLKLMDVLESDGLDDDNGNWRLWQLAIFGWSYKNDDIQRPWALEHGMTCYLENSFGRN